MIETIEFGCDHCQAANRLATRKLLELSGRPRCGKCGEPLFRMLNKNFSDLDPASYQHPLDGEALERLQKIPGIQTLLRKVIRSTLELNLRLSQAANTVQVSEQQMPDVHAHFCRAAQALGVAPLPELYVVQSPAVNATTFGVDQYFVTITTGALDLLDEDELLAVFGHELGHIHSDHMLYKTTARFVSSLASQIAAVTLGIGGLITLPLHLALQWWDRCAELTADRASLLVVQRPEVVLRLLMKLAGGSPQLAPQMNFEAFLQQADRLQEMSSANRLARAMIFMQELTRSHPFPVYRAKEIVSWLTAGNFLEILDGEFQPRPARPMQVCAACQKEIDAAAMLCPHCGAKPETGEVPPDQGDADFWQETQREASETYRAAAQTLRGAVGEAALWWKKTFEEPDHEHGDDDVEKDTPRHEK